MKARGDVLHWLQGALRYEGDDCLPFPYGIGADGYGAVWVGGKMVRVNRWMCEAAHGAAPSPKHHAAHSCGARICVNKRHLRWATRSENEADKLLHGRSNRGERQGGSRLTAERVREIRQSSEKQRDLAKRLGVAEQTICNIKKRRSWAWL